MAVLLLLLLCGASSADMGYFGSITQNPVPLGELPTHPRVELTCQDVFIELFRGGDARLTASFLFHNSGSAEEVMMYFPVSVMVPTISVLWSMEDLSDPLTSPVVTVDGSPVEVRPMLSANWSSTWSDRWWEGLEDSLSLVLPPPADSGTVFFTVDPGYWTDLDLLERSLADSCGALDLAVLGEVRSSHALWTVHFDEGADVLVEYTMVLTLRHDPEVDWYSLSYPLCTGASWAGSIGSGRIVIVPSRGLTLADVTEWSSVSMPEGSAEEDLEYLPMSEIEAHPSFRGSLSERATRVVLPEALVWEFRDLEPVVSPMGWIYYYEDPEGSAARNEMDLMSWDQAPPEWPSSLRVVIRNDAMKH